MLYETSLPDSRSGVLLFLPLLLTPALQTNGCLRYRIRIHQTCHLSPNQCILRCLDAGYSTACAYQNDVTVMGLLHSSNDKLMLLSLLPVIEYVDECQI